MSETESEKLHGLSALLRSVVKVQAISDAPDYEQPWQTSGPSSSFGSGAIVKTLRGAKILTNAHCVENHTFVEVKRHGQAAKVIATVEAVGHDCDLALLDVDPSFYRGIKPLEIGPLPHLGDKVQVCGFPVGGDRLSLTQGIVSRIDLTQYDQSQRNLLAIQIDAAINSGNSGGPVLDNGKLVGIAFQLLDGADRVGHMIAPSVISHFLHDVNQGTYRGFPGLGIEWQALESKVHRQALGLHSHHSGILVTRVGYESSAWMTVQPGDVLLEVDNTPIGPDGTVQLREAELVGFEHVVSRRHVGETISLTLFRDGRQLDCLVVLQEPKPLVAEDHYEVAPSYLLVGGLLMVPLTRDYLKTWGEQWWQTAPKDLVCLYEHGVATPDRQEIVVLQKVLADSLNQGFHELESVWIERIQGVSVRSLAHAASILDATDEPYYRLESADGRQIVLDRKECIRQEDAILSRYGVPENRSPDLIQRKSKKTPTAESWPSSFEGLN